MQTTPSTPSPRDEVLRRVGRNVVNFQYLEATLRSMIPSLGSEGSTKDWQSNLNATNRRYKKASLGDLTDTFLERVFGSSAGPSAGDDEPAQEPTFSFSLQIAATPERQAEQRNALLKLVIERNRLIHRDALDGLS